MEKLGAQLTFLDLSGSMMCRLTDVGMSSIADYCTKLEMLGIRLLKDVTGLSLVPLFEDHKRAPRLESLLISLRKVSGD